MYPKTNDFLEASGAVRLGANWQNEWYMHDDESGAALITWLVDAYQSGQADRDSTKELIAHIYDDSAQLLESGIVTFSVYLVYCWSRFLLHGEADSTEAPELFFDAVHDLYHEAAVFGRVPA